MWEEESFSIVIVSYELNR